MTPAMRADGADAARQIARRVPRHAADVAIFHV
jgi:hypothetical protein